MKALDELSHYEVLEVHRDATPQELERAYRIACSTYGRQSLAVYSVYDDAEARAIRERIDEAWQVLSDPRSRSEYDASLSAARPGAEPKLPVEISLAFEPDAGAAPEPELAPLEGFEADPDAHYDGSRLRRSRIHRGIEIEQIAEVTKINPTYLRFIEDERFDDLPAPVYVRGFLCAYARYVGLDAEQVASSYMARLQGSRELPPASRRRG